VVIEPRDKRMVYQFANRQTNANIFQKLSEAIFMKEFIPVDPGAGWKTNEIPYMPNNTTAAVPADPALRTATPGLPANPNNKRPQ
jgi:hypothetical protein